MKLEDQVTAFELSKRLHELGVKQESLFNWQIGSSKEPTLNLSFMGELECNSFSAFTASELLELLPKFFISIFFSSNQCVARFTYVVQEKDFYGDSLPDSLAKMLIRLTEIK